MNVYSIFTHGALLPLILVMSENTGPFGFTEFVLLMLLRGSNIHVYSVLKSLNARRSSHEHEHMLENMLDLFVL